MKKYLLFLPIICIVYIVILVIKKSDTAINTIPSKEFTQVTSLDNIAASNLLPIDQQKYIIKPYSNLNMGLSTNQFSNQLFDIPTTLDNISAYNFFNLDHSFSARYMMKASYSDWTGGFEIKAINPENFAADLITSSYKVSANKGKLDNFYDLKALNRHKNLGEMQGMNLKFDDANGAPQILTIPQDALEPFNKMATALEELHKTKPKLFVQNYYLDENGTKQSMGTYMLPFRGVLCGKTLKTKLYRSDYIIDIDNNILTITEKAKNAKNSQEAYELLFTPIYYCPEKELFASFKSQQYFFYSMNLVLEYNNKQDLGYNYQTIVDFGKEKALDKEKALEVVKALQSQEFKEFGIDFLKPFTDIQKPNSEIQEYLDNLLDFFYCADTIFSLKKAINTQTADQITKVIKEFYKSLGLRRVQSNAEDDRAWDDNILTKLRVENGVYSYEIRGVWKPSYYNPGKKLSLKLLQELLLVENTTNHEFNLDTLDVEILNKNNLSPQQIKTNETIKYLENLTFEGADVTEAVKAIFASFPVNYSFNVTENLGIYAGGKIALGYLSIVQKSKTQKDNNQRQAELTCRQEGNTFNLGLEFGVSCYIQGGAQIKAGLSWSTYGILSSINELTITKGGLKDDVIQHLLLGLVARKAVSLSSPSVNDGLFGMQELRGYLAMSLPL